MEAEEAVDLRARVVTLERRTPFPVAITDVVPSYRLGLSAAFADVGFRTEDPADIDDWIRLPGARGLVVTVGVPDDCEVIRGFAAANPNLLIVALLRHPVPEMYIRALQAGASGAVIAVVQSARHQHVLLPCDVARAIAAGVTLPADLGSIGSAEVKWLQMMGKGRTVAQLARAVGYSEREMFRLLRQLYDRMGVRNRTEALLKAAQCGLLAE